MKSVCLKDITCLDLDKAILSKFDPAIKTVKDLCNKTRKDLKEMNFSSEEINQIIIKLQLNGVDLGKKYK